MPKGDNLKGKGGKLFSKDNQPTPKAKSDGRRRINTIKDVLAFIGEQVASKKNTVDGEFDFSMQAEVIYKQVEKALKGDTESAKFLARIGGWESPKQIEQKTTLIGLESEFVD